MPAHWLTYEGRRSVLASASANRKAERPVNALLNYAFALLEAEAVLACQATGLDPGLGIVHADATSRHSMALDILEPARPEVEGHVLDLLASHTFAKSDFSEDREGHMRVRAPLTHELADMMPLMARWLAPWAEKVAHMLGAVMEGKYTARTPLTSSKTRAAQAVVKARKAEASRAKGARPPNSAPPNRSPCRYGTARAATPPWPTLAMSYVRGAKQRRATPIRCARQGAGPLRRASGRLPSGWAPSGRTWTPRCTAWRYCPAWQA